MTVDTLGKYVLGPILGQGGMGVVYRSVHPQLNRPVAIKVIRSNITDPQAHQRFMREAQIVAGLVHSHIIRIFDIDVQEGQPYIVMDFVEGQSLEQRLQAEPLPPEVVLQIMVPLTRALDYAHRQGVIHRDLKPANVLLKPDGSPILADFGIARPLDTHSSTQLTATGALIGTVAYIAPEQFLGTDAGQQSDIYALGIMFFEMLTGRPPFTGDAAQMMYGHLNQAPPALTTHHPHLPAALDQLVQHMLAKDPADRPQTATEIDHTLHTIHDTMALSDSLLALTNEAPPQAIGAVALSATAPVDPAAVAETEATPPAVRPRLRSKVSMRGCLLVSLATFTLISVLVLLMVVLEVNVTTADDVGSIADPTSPIGEPTDRLDGPLPFEPFGQPSTFPKDELEWRTETALHNAQSVGPETFTIGNMDYGYNDLGSLQFLGEIRNDHETARDDIEIRIALLDEQGQELSNQSTRLPVLYLNPGEISPFEITFFEGEDLPEVVPSSYMIEIHSAESTPDMISYAVHHSIVEEPSQLLENNRVSLSGPVHNESDEYVGSVRIWAVFYDANDTVVGLSQTFIDTDVEDNVLPPGETASFDLETFDFTTVPTSYRLLFVGTSVSE
ncbi:MAG: protein kinase [Chloroflexota bacterium]